MVWPSTWCMGFLRGRIENCSFGNIVSYDYGWVNGFKAWGIILVLALAVMVCTSTWCMYFLMGRIENFSFGNIVYNNIEELLAILYLIAGRNILAPIFVHIVINLFIEP